MANTPQMSKIILVLAEWHKVEYYYKHLAGRDWQKQNNAVLSIPAKLGLSQVN